MKTAQFYICYIGRGVANSCYYGKTSYVSESAAIKKLDALNSKEDKPMFEILTLNQMTERMNEKVEVINLMSGQPVMISATSVGTCTDPSTETYWSM